MTGSIDMRDSTFLAKIMREALARAREPEGYAELRAKLIASRPKRLPPMVKQSPENLR